MSAKNENKPKGTTLTKLDEFVTSVDGSYIWRNKESIAGSTLIERGEEGRPIEGQIFAQEKLTRRKAINLALARETQEEVYDEEAKLRAGYLQRMFWKDEEIKLDADDITFIKNRLNHRFSSTVFCHMCEYLEGVKT